MACHMVKYPSGASWRKRARSSSGSGCARERTASGVLHDDAVVEVPMQGACRNAEPLAASLTVSTSPSRVAAGRVVRQLPGATKRPHGFRREGLAVHGPPPLSIEDRGDRRVGVVGCDPSQQPDRLFVGSEYRHPRRPGNDVKLRDRPPLQRIVSPAVLSPRLISIETSSRRVCRSSLRSRSLVVGADHTERRSVPRRRSCERSASESECACTRRLSSSWPLPEQAR